MRLFQILNQPEARVMPPTTMGTLSPDRVAALEHAVELVLAGKYHSVPLVDCPLGRKIKDMAQRLEAKALRQLKSDVDFAVGVNEAVTDAAGRMRSVDEIDRRSKVVASAALDLAAGVGDVRDRIEHLCGELGTLLGALAGGPGGEDAAVKLVTAAGSLRDIAQTMSAQAETSAEVWRGVATVARMAADNADAIGAVVGVMDRSGEVIARSLSAMAGMEIEDLAIHLAKSDHVMWKKHLADMISGHQAIDPDDLPDHRHCRLGRWCETVADPDIRNHPAFRALELPHQQVHSQGIEAARLYRAGDLDGAMACIDRVGEASKEMLRCLDELGERRRCACGIVH